VSRKGQWGQTVRIETGGWADYERLSVWHYLAGAPRVVDVILRAVCDAPGVGPQVAGVLVVSHPALFGWWRDEAWPGRYISRVIVDPRFRALGVASSLVRAYLANPRTRRTEAAAAMGGLCPFFARAGMREHIRGPDRFSQELKAWLATKGIRAADLIDADRATRALKRPGVEKHLRWWCGKSFSTMRSAHRPLPALAAIVAARVWGTRRAYTWDAQHIGGVETPGRNRGGSQARSQSSQDQSRSRGRH
jgi:GNAT superfamily N-acetyltransferase